MIVPAIVQRNKKAWHLSKDHLVNAATGTTSTCRSCENLIEFGAIRLGFIFTHRQGFILIEWHHINCIAVPQHFSSRDSLEDSNLSTEQVRLVHLWSLTPSKLKPAARVEGNNRRHTSY